MKKLFAVTLVASALAVLLTTSAFAAGPVTPPNQDGVGYGNRAGAAIHEPGTGLVEGTVPGGRGRAQGAVAGARGGMQGAAAGVRGGAPEWAGNSETAASILGLTAEELQAERLAGQSLAAIAESKGIGVDSLVAQLLESRTATVNQLLAAGTITQAQADYMLSNAAERIQTMVERTEVGRPDFAGQSPMAGAGRGRGNR